MKCPNCRDVTLVMTERQGVEIDYCPQCRGVWLDRGELDKLIERGALTQQPPAPTQPPQGYAQHIPPPQAPQQSYRPGLFDAPQQPHHQHQQPYPPQQQPYPPQQRYPDDGYYRQRKRKSWLSEIFDD
jgi:uncharacterized protein